VRVKTDTLDRFLSTVGEVILNSNQLRTSADASAQSKTAGLAGGLDRMDRAVGELQRRALELRTTPLLRIVEPLPRVAREVAQLAGKRVEVEIQGAELDLDRSILDRLSDPLVHLVRNAVDHGIETPEARAAVGKPEVGRVTIDARRVKDSIRIAVRDDGEGIDLEAVRARAVERGLVVLDLAEDLSPEDVASFVFHPGLSTAERSSRSAGRSSSPPSPGWVRARPSWCRSPQRFNGCCWWRPPVRRWRFRFAGWSASSSSAPTRSNAVAARRSP
jgi:two-component system chemotaxis sensor kinase CheA